MKAQLPESFQNRMREMLGPEYEEYEKSFDSPHHTGLRVNTLKLKPEEFEKISPFLINRIPFIENGFYIKEDQPSKHPYYFGGLYYIQEPSAMTPASLLPVNPGDKVLDLCAAPGGKSTELAAKLNGQGILISNDISNSRAKALLKNIEIFGVRNAVVMSEAPDKLAKTFENYFDKILVDAPCSGEGMFRKSPVIMKNWEQYGTGYYSKLQKEILVSAVKMLKPGGYLLYSTCTFSPEENEGTVVYIKSKYPELSIVPSIPESISKDIPLQEVQRLSEIREKEKQGVVSYENFSFGRPDWADGTEELIHCLRLWPHKIEGEGHFAVLFRKEDKKSYEESVILENQTLSAEKASYSRAKNQIAGSRRNQKINILSQSEEFVNFLGHIAFSIKERQLELREDRIYWIPDGLPDMKGLRILRSGLFLGEIKKKRFEPSQALACALRMQDYDTVYQLSSEDLEVIHYLKCESIELKKPCPDGYILICVDGYPLGWGKVANGKFKNKYLPGWRWM